MSYWPKSERPLVLLAPMDGYTDPPFRRFVKRIEPRAVVFSEFLSARLVTQKPALADSMFQIYPDEEPVVIQLYGKDPEDFKRAALLAEQRGAAGIDINMGCPAKKVVAHRHGSALMKEIDLACRIVAEVKRAIGVPLSVKTRLGWENEDNLIPFARRLEGEGLDAITIHGRTYSQKFEGEANWEPIYALKKSLGIPVFGNGDVDSAGKALRRLGNLDGVMVGRAAVADPWVLQRICSAFYENEPAERKTPFQEKAPLWQAFAEMLVGHYRAELHACRVLRKFLVRLVKELGLSVETRRLSTQVSSLEDVRRVLEIFVEESAHDSELAGVRSLA